MQAHLAAGHAPTARSRRFRRTAVGNTRNDMYLTSEAIRFLIKDKGSELTPDDVKKLNAYKAEIDASTKFIPIWVKIAVAIALGLGTMIGWKRIVVTVGEKIGKQHLTYAQGASAELVAMTHDLRRRHVRPAGFDDSCAFLRCRGKPWRPTSRDCSSRRSAIC